MKAILIELAGAFAATVFLASLASIMAGWALERDLWATFIPLLVGAALYQIGYTFGRIYQRRQ